MPITSTPTIPPESLVEPQSKKSKKVRQLTAEEEDDMAEWLEDNPCIYNKKLDSYRQTDMKKRQWIEKAIEYPNVDVEYLMSWYRSMRTHFGKLSKLPTGSDLTERDEGILCKFSWLKTHISRQKGNQLGGLTKKLSTAAGPSTSRRLSSGEDSDDDTCDVALSIQEDCTPSDICCPQSCPPEVQSAPTSATSSASKSKSRSKVRSSDSILKVHVVESRRLQDKVETLLCKQETFRDSQVQFGLFFPSMIPHIDETMMIDFMDNSY